jgi:hypothetical protein
MGCGTDIYHGGRRGWVLRLSWTNTTQSNGRAQSMSCGIVGWLPRPREVKRHATLVGPQVKIARHKLRALGYPNGCREPHLSPDSFQHLPTSAPRKLNRGSIAGAKRENVSMIVSTRSFVPVANWSCTKSIAQVSLDRVAGRRSSRSLALTELMRHQVFCSSIPGFEMPSGGIPSSLWLCKKRAT